MDTKAGTTRFPNARYVISDRAWDFWSDPERQGSFPEGWRGMIQGTQAAFKLIADRTTRIKPGAEIVSGIATVESRGHTPGHMSVHLASSGEQALVTRDAVTNGLISFAYPEWQPGYDGEMDQAVVTRRRLLDQAATDRVLLLGYHLPFPGAGSVARDGAAYRWVPEHWTSEAAISFERALWPESRAERTFVSLRARDSRSELNGEFVLSAGVNTPTPLKLSITG